MGKKAIVTGGAGFIGSHLVRRLIENGFTVLNIDKLSYAGNIENLRDVKMNDRYQLLQHDIADFPSMNQAIKDFRPNVIFHLAAESHVDRSIDSSDDFVHSNIVGTHSLLKAARNYFEAVKTADFKFIHVSTDEVYGSLDLQEAAFTEASTYYPNSPYSASKAASDHLVRAWFETFNLPTIITHCSNNYGPNQNEEKLIPRMISHALGNKKLPVYGNGKNVRDWLHVVDHCDGLIAAYSNGTSGEVYNYGGNTEIENIALVTKICEILDSLQPRPDGQSYMDQIDFVDDRMGHDFRYAINIEKARKQLHWKPTVNFNTGLVSTIDWYLKEMG
jgi:dTDP-glucose 4,6-dehydratase